MHPIDPMNPSSWSGGYPPVSPISDGTFVIPPGIHVAQPTPSTGPETWAPWNVLQQANYTTFPHTSSVVPATPNSPLQPVTSGRPLMLTYPPDYVWVPQRPYTLTAHHFAPAPPIVFNVDGGEPGITLSAALNRRFSHLRDRDDLVFESSKSPTITLRLEVCCLFELAQTLADGA